MKKTTLTLLSILFFIASEAQVTRFRSLGVTISEKNKEGNFAELKSSIIQEMRINVNLDQKKVQFFSKGMLSSDTFTLRKEISILTEITSPDDDNDKSTTVFSGINKWGENCIIRLKPARDEYRTQDGELQIEYLERVEIYKLRTLNYSPFYNRS